MTKDEAVAALKAVRAANLRPDGNERHTGDAHEQADVVLLEYIGDPEIRAAYEECTPFWYE